MKRDRKDSNDSNAVGIFSNLDSNKAVYDMDIYVRVLNQVLNKMDNEYLKEKYKAYQRKVRENKTKQVK